VSLAANFKTQAVAGDAIVEESSTTPLIVEHQHDEGLDGGSSTAPVVTVIVATAVLYFARGILMPLTMAAVLAVIFSPIASRLERFVGAFASAALVVAATVTVVFGIGYFVTVELTSVAVQVTDYTDNIATKLTALKGTTPEWLRRVQDGVKDVERQLSDQSSRSKRSTPAKVVQAPAVEPNLEQVVRPVVPILSGMFEALLVVMLMFFLLYGRRDLRDRLVRLAARARVTLAAEAIGTAGDAVGHYLLLFALTNLGYGVAIGLTIWIVGLPNPLLWGTLAALFRFVPYVGVPVAALLPTFVAFAVFPGWSKSIEVLASFVILDQIVSYLVEPFLIGRGVGLSPLALLFSAMFWAWLWGFPGLLLATSLTACLKVAGDYIPALGFFAVLFGDDSAREDYHDYYRSLLELDRASARNIAIEYCDKHGLEPSFDDVLVPAVILADEERSGNHISKENQSLVYETTAALVKELGDRFNKPRFRGRLRIVGITPPGEVHSLGLLMLLELLRRTGIAANFLDQNKSPAEICAFVNQYAPDMVFVSCTTTECMPAALELVRALMAESPQLTIIGGGASALSHRSELLEAGAAQICGSRGEVRHAVRIHALRRSVSRSSKISSDRSSIDTQTAVS
jgi:predicted PurR-regulated permease PerM/methylmalonyl-CoA mutase cobalamin-binding subunit